MPRRLLLVHAHPDDEVINTGATMAHYAADGVDVTLLTCTLGEEGEILVPSLAQLASDQADQLGGYRMGELASAVAHLGVVDHCFLGGAGRFRDSGMMGTPANRHPRAFWRAAEDDAVFAAAVAAATEVVREVRPQVLVTYDPNGGYGHPDHIMAHRVAMAAVSAAAEDSGGATPWTVAKVYWIVTPFWAPADDDEPSFGTDDGNVTTAVNAAAFRQAKRDALGAHATQVSVSGDVFALSNGVGRQIDPTEYYRLVHGEPGGDRAPDGRETDLFGGLDL